MDESSGVFLYELISFVSGLVSEACACLPDKITGKEVKLLMFCGGGEVEERCDNKMEKDEAQ